MFKQILKRIGLISIALISLLGIFETITQHPVRALVLLHREGITFPLTREIFGEPAMNSSKNPSVHVNWWDTLREDPRYYHLPPNPNYVVNRIPNASNMCDKGSFASSMEKMQKTCNENYDFLPLTFKLPEEGQKFERSRASAAGRNTKFILKPAAGTFGKGIIILNPGEAIPPDLRDKRLVAQEYIEPYLIDGRKFDFRVYILVTSLNPLHIYLYQDGLVRFCAGDYGGNSNWSNFTNTAINKNYICADGQRIGYEEITKTFADVFPILENDERFNRGEFYNQLGVAFTRALVASMPELFQGFRRAFGNFPSASMPSKCFQIFGCDVLLDTNLQPKLLEMNYRPSLGFGMPKEKELKENLLKETVALVEDLHSQNPVRTGNYMEICPGANGEDFQQEIDKLFRARLPEACNHARRKPRNDDQPRRGHLPPAPKNPAQQPKSPARRGQLPPAPKNPAQQPKSPARREHLPPAPKNPAQQPKSPVRRGQLPGNDEPEGPQAPFPYQTHISRIRNAVTQRVFSGSTVDDKKQAGLIYWDGPAPKGTNYFGDVSKNQIVNRLPDDLALGDKGRLTRAIQIFQEKSPFAQYYNFYPRSSTLPDERCKLEKERRQSRKKFIVKPSNGECGRGIEILEPKDKLPSFAGKTAVAQEYIEPYLIDEKKFDCRFYVLVASLNPLRIFLYNDGMARFCAQRYGRSSPCATLTNTAINKNFPGINIEDIEKLTSKIFRQLSDSGHNVQDLLNKINQAISRTVIAALPALYGGYEKTFGKRPTSGVPSQAFQVLGFDVLLDKKLNPIVLEVNERPSFVLRGEAPEIVELKINVVRDAARLACDLNATGGQDRREIDFGGFTEICNSSRGDYQPEIRWILSQRPLYSENLFSLSRNRR